MKFTIHVKGLRSIMHKVQDDEFGKNNDLFTTFTRPLNNLDETPCELLDRSQANYTPAT